MKRDAIDFERERIPVLFRKLLVPALLGTLSISAVTAIDGIFVGHGVGPDGVAAVNLILPIFQLISGIGLMMGAGCSVVTSIHLSRQKVRVARINITQALVFASTFAALLWAAIWLFPEQSARLLGASDTLLQQVMDYAWWIMPCFVFQMWSMIGLFVVRLDGAPHIAMWCSIIAAFLNGVLDWVFIFPLGMGVKGAAIATSFCISLGGLMTITYLLFFAHRLRPLPLKFSRKSFMLACRNIGYQCRIGSITLLGELSLAILVYVGNLVFMEHLGDAGVGAFGIACYYTPFFFMVGNAIAQSAQPIISYNYGVARWREIREARRLLFLTSLSIGTLVALLFVLVPDVLVALFVDPDNEASHIAVRGFPYLATGIIFFILNVAVIGYYQSVERIRRATLFVFLRGFIFLIPCFLLLPLWFGTDGIWLSMPAAEICTTLCIMALYALTR